MAHYFFNLEGNHGGEDDLGMELPDDDSAQREAICYAGELLRDDPRLIWDGSYLVVQVTDIRRRPLFDVIVQTRVPSVGRTS